MTLISEIQSTLSKIQAAVGDLPIVLKAVEADAETVIHSFEVSYDAKGDPTGSSVTITHGAAPEPTPDEPTATEPPANDPPQA